MRHEKQQVPDLDHGSGATTAILTITITITKQTTTPLREEGSDDRARQAPYQRTDFCCSLYARDLKPLPDNQQRAHYPHNSGSHNP